jgi:hypothetical protein
VPGYADAWKKVRPSKFDPKIDKLVTDAMKDLDAMNARWIKAPNREALMALSGSTKNAVRAVEEGLKAMGPNAAVKGPKAWLTATEKEVKAAAQQATVLQRGLVAFYQELDNKHKALLNDIKIMLARPGASVAKLAQTKADEFMNFMNKESTLYQGGDFVKNLAIFGSQIRLSLVEIVKTYDAIAKENDPAKKQKLTATVNHHLTDFKKTATRFASPLKVDQIKIKGPAQQLKL